MLHKSATASLRVRTHNDHSAGMRPRPVQNFAAIRLLLPVFCISQTRHQAHFRRNSHANRLAQRCRRVPRGSNPHRSLGRHGAYTTAQFRRYQTAASSVFRLANPSLGPFWRKFACVSWCTTGPSRDSGFDPQPFTPVRCTLLLCQISTEMVSALRF